ncbi:hypothetical protein TOPH_07691 [Tolypocladium ophioglossoides CBS 100239]|uniref:non-specific serine/threonine protein kinase n=1 Tax=Tolypocladium ophioglossoides (strain CBS 100239) TaxID=1163406 RepID=A0A0L0N1I8_TOLOC|nr:hypothetical protein TOPH_07691 [Tolypocladium ophioglossoides CBS 100239]
MAPSSSRTNDTLLSLDPGPSDILYRIQRVRGEHSRVLYVTVANPAVIPEDKRTHGRSAIAELSKLDKWSDDWTTLIVHKDNDGIWCEVDKFRPHALPKDVLDDYPAYDISHFETRHSFNHRVSEVVHGGRAYVLKIARFPHEVPALTRELKAYHRLAGSSLAPRLIGYAFEESPDRIVGFLVESIHGRVAGVSDFESCREALHQLHQHLIHGDLCRYNILITSEGPKFIDFENSILSSTKDWSRRRMDAEMQGLAGKLADTSVDGRPWNG